MSPIRGAVPWRRAVPAVMVALTAGWLSIAIGVANISYDSNPAQALLVWPFDARAQAKRAEQLSAGLQNGLPNSALSASLIRYARDALARDPTVVPAWRTLGLLAVLEQQPQKAAMMFRLSEQLSRRDFPTQLWFIEDGVARHDVPGALHHYDIALRSSLSTYEVLLPQLVSATGTSEIIAPLAKVLRQAPEWRRAFYVDLASGAPNNSNIALLLTQVAAQTGITDRDIVANIANRMASEGDYAAAWQVYTLLRPHADIRTPIRDGNFANETSIPPFEWLLTAEADTGAERQHTNNAKSGAVLSIYANTGTSVEVARQMLLLPPGQWSLTSISGTPSDSAAATLNWSIVCLNREATRLLQQTILPGPDAPHSTAFTNPSGCPAQWLILTATGIDQGGATAQVHEIRITAP